jgi:hypothetical protein
LLFRKLSPAVLDGLPRAIECGHQDTDGARIKDIIIAEEVTHFAPMSSPKIISARSGDAIRTRLAR